MILCRRLARSRSGCCPGHGQNRPPHCKRGLCCRRRDASAGAWFKVQRLKRWRPWRRTPACRRLLLKVAADAIGEVHQYDSWSPRACGLEYYLVRIVPRFSGRDFAASPCHRYYSAHGGIPGHCANAAALIKPGWRQVSACRPVTGRRVVGALPPPAATQAAQSIS